MSFDRISIFGSIELFDRSKRAGMPQIGTNIFVLSSLRFLQRVRVLYSRFYYFYSIVYSGARHDDTGPAGSPRPSEHPDVRDDEPEIPGVRVAEVVVHRLEHNRQSGPRRGFRTELRKLLSYPRRAAEYTVLPDIRQSVPQLGQLRADGGDGELQRSTGGGKAGQQRLATLLITGRGDVPLHRIDLRRGSRSGILKFVIFKN